MRCLVLEFNKVNKNNRFYSATTEEVKSLIDEMEAKNRNFLTKGFNPSGEPFTIEKALSIELGDIIGKFSNFEILEEPNVDSEETLPIIQVYADFKPLNEMGKLFDEIHPNIGFGLRGISKVDKINDIKVEKIKTITCFDLI